MLKYNIGCGENKLEGFVNVDMAKNSVVEPDLILDIRYEKLPCTNETVDQIWMIHTLEHVEYRYWASIFHEYSRVLKPNGKLFLAYPEFFECAKRFANNVGGQRAFWRATLYGRQLWPSDYHIAPVDSKEVKAMLETLGFYRIKFQPEQHEPYNSNLAAMKDPNPITREQVITKELHL